MDPIAFTAMAAVCAPLVDVGTARALVATESGFNENAIGVVGGALDRQPRHRAEALATVRQLKAQGWNFSIGLGQINARNFDRLGLTPETALDPCASLRAMQSVLIECFERTRAQTSPQAALRQTLSCYYSGNFVTGFAHGYVQRVTQAALP